MEDKVRVLMLPVSEGGPKGKRPEELLSVRDLTVEYDDESGPVRAVHDVSFEIARGESHGIVGQSGSGKSTAVRALLGLLPPTARIVGGTATVSDEDVLGARGPELRRIRRSVFGFVSQNPFGALNPVYRIKTTFRDVLAACGVARGDMYQVATKSLVGVGLSDPDLILASYPHELSGGMAQRVVIAINLAKRSSIVVADEPTTALDLTVQKQILDLLASIVAEGTGLILVSHNLSVVANYCDTVSVMFAGRVVEQGPVRQVFTAPSHPYTAYLLAASDFRMASQDMESENIQAGLLWSPVTGDRCGYRNACPYAEPRCHSDQAATMARVEGDQYTRCIRTPAAMHGD